MKKKFALLAIALAPMMAFASGDVEKKPEVAVTDVKAAPAEATENMKKQKALWLAFQGKRLPLEQSLVNCVTKASTLDAEQKCFSEIGGKLGELQQKFQADMMKLQPQPEAAPQKAEPVKADKKAEKKDATK